MVKGNERRPVHACACPLCQQHPDSPTAEEHRALNRLMAATDERSRRLLAGLLARQHGRGGIALLARVTGLSPHTIRRGWRELQQPGGSPAGRLRRPGAGRQRVGQKVPRW